MPRDTKNEARRIEALQRLQILDSGAEAFFDALVQAAAEVTTTPISLITLIDRHRQWFKANYGLQGVQETPREYAFCEHVVQSGSMVQVPDATKDPRFAENPFVTGEPHIQSYVGVPLTLSDGTHLGALCVIDREPRNLRPDQLRVLRHLAAAASMALEQRGALIEQREAAVAEATRARQLERALAEREQFLQRTSRVAGVGGWEFDLRTQVLRWTDQTCRIHELPEGFEPSLDQALSFFQPEVQASLARAMEAASSHGQGWDMTIPMTTAAGRAVWVRAVGGPEYEDGVLVRLAGALQDVTDRKAATLALEASERRYRKLFQYSLGLICTHDLHGVILSVNPSAAASLGRDVSQMVGVSLGQFMSPAQAPLLGAYLERIMRQRIATGILELVSSDGTIRQWRYQNVLDDEADEPYVLGHAQDVTEQRRYENTLLEWSTRDPLTQAMNRRYLGQLEKRAEEARPWAAIVVDMDHFKAINDTYGHARGDEVLVQTAQLLRDSATAQDVVVRMGGDEFLLVLDDADQLDEVLGRLARACRACGLSFSTGSATSRPGETADAVIARADEDLYARRMAVRPSAS